MNRTVATVLVAAVIAASGCVLETARVAEGQTCGDRTCPPGYVCSESGKFCVTEPAPPTASRCLCPDGTEGTEGTGGTGGADDSGGIGSTPSCLTEDRCDVAEVAAYLAEHYADELRGASGPTGPTGASGPVGPTGPGGAWIPPGTIAFFTLLDCPEGWSEYADARGRFIVGLPESGDLEATIGAPLLNREQRDHAHGYADVPAHAHGVDPPEGETTEDGGHSHETYHYGMNTSLGSSPPATFGEAIKGVPSNQLQVNTTGGAGVHSHALDLPSFDSAPTGVETAETDAGGAATTPFVQLLACQKN